MNDTDTHLRVGVYPGPVAVDLPRRIGMARAREMSLTGNAGTGTSRWTSPSTRRGGSTTNIR
ncbi:MAG TPA: hypothetical protein VKH61_16170 [Streptosporangiaceae bacterium]|nr:hypothetical protein [Streptosporangiaceae bacterium]